MMFLNTKVVFAVSLIASLLVAPPVFANNSLRLMTEEFIPYQFYEGKGEDRKITGISIEIIQAVQNRINNKSSIKVLPWARALKILKLKKNSALFSTVRTPAREEKYKWVGPISKLEMVFFKKAGSNIKIESIADAKKVAKLGVTKDVATHEILNNMGFENLDVMQSGRDEKNLTRLTKGRIDLWASPYFAGIFSARKLEVLGKVEAIRDVPFMSGSLYIAFNKETDDNIINQWQSALDELKQEGVVQKILGKYDW